MSNPWIESLDGTCFNCANAETCPNAEQELSKTTEIYKQMKNFMHTKGFNKLILCHGCKDFKKIGEIMFVIGTL